VGSFNAVVTTGIYCLPSCTGRPDRNNVRTFELAAAAEAAGFRACLRCRPYRTEPAISNRVVPQLLCHAVRLIVDGVLDEATEDDLGAKLGVSGRHLRRLFVEHLGLTPDQLARSTRVHFARRLLEDSDLSISDITYAAGFGSVRQFNRACQEIFHATPSELRARRRNGDRLVADAGVALRIPFQPPLDWQGMLACMRSRAIDGVEQVSAGTYRRTVLIGGDPGVLEISAGDAGHLVLRAHLPHWKGLIHIAQRVRRVFNLDCDVQAAYRHLSPDPLIGPLATGRPGVRPPGAWDLFEAGIEAIVGEHASLADTAATMRRIAERYGTPVPGMRALGLARTFPEPPELVSADLDGLGLDQSRIIAIREIAQAAADRPAVADPTRRARSTDLAESIRTLSTQSAQSLCLRLGEPDAFPSASPTLLRALSARTGRVTPQMATRIAEAWRPWRAHAAAYLWLSSPELVAYGAGPGCHGGSGDRIRAGSAKRKSERKSALSRR
jgi:AraC family transcriptional regulator, regulatory protein of adaptative response / DNA-3-methyladenine glycosylase II